MFGDAARESDAAAGRRADRSRTSANPYDGNAYAISEGQRLFSWYNCTGCHANGGGGIGPPLIKTEWIYGGEPANLFDTIVKGRPNGMPAWGGKIPEYQIWQIVAFVRSHEQAGAEGGNARARRHDRAGFRHDPRTQPQRCRRNEASRLLGLLIVVPLRLRSAQQSALDPAGPKPTSIASFGGSSSAARRDLRDRHGRWRWCRCCGGIAASSRSRWSRPIVPSAETERKLARSGRRRDACHGRDSAGL